MEKMRKVKLTSSGSSAGDAISGYVHDFLSFKEVTLHYNQQLNRKRRLIKYYVLIAFCLGVAAGIAIFA